MTGKKTVNSTAQTGSKHLGDKPGVDLGDINPLNTNSFWHANESSKKPPPQYRDKEGNIIPQKIGSQGERLTALGIVQNPNADKTSDRYLSAVAGLNAHDARTRDADKPGATGMASVAKNSGLPSGKESSARLGGLGFGVGSTSTEAAKVTAIERTQEAKATTQPSAPKPAQSNGGYTAAQFNSLQKRYAQPDVPLDKVAVKDTIDYSIGIVDNRGTAVDQTQYVNDNTDKINAAFENMKKVAFIDSDAYRKDFMKDNYKGFNAVQDILSGLRLGLTGQSSGQTNADRVNALLAEKLNTIRDKNKDAEIQLGLDQQKSLLGESTRVANTLSAAALATAQENAGFGRDYSKDVATAKVKTAEDARNTAYENETNVNAALNKQAQERYARELAPFLLEQGNEIALQNKLKEMAIMDARLEGLAAQAEKILQTQGTAAYKRFIAARLGQVYDGGLVTNTVDAITDIFTGRGGGN
jgi:hypothetical protein